MITHILCFDGITPGPRDFDELIGHGTAERHIERSARQNDAAAGQHLQLMNERCKDPAAEQRIRRSCRNTERKPRRIAALKGVRIAQAAIGGWHCLAVSAEGQVYAWGGNEYGQCGLTSKDTRPSGRCVTAVEHAPV